MGFDPVSMMLITTAVSAVASGASSLMGASQQKGQYDAQARLYQQQAQQQQAETALRTDDINRRANKAAGRIAAMAGGAGVDIGGSVIDNIGNVYGESSRDIFNVKFSGDARAQNLWTSAQNAFDMGQQTMDNAYTGLAFKGLNLFGGAALSGLNSFLTPTTTVTANANTYGDFRPETKKTGTGWIGGGL